MADLKIGVVLGSTRQGRLGEHVANWIMDRTADRDGADYELVDLRDYPMPFFDGVSPAYVPPSDPEVQRFAAKIAEFDGYVFITPEYNHSFSGVLKNALDSIYPEFNNKAAGFASYGSLSGARAVEQLRLVSSELQLAHVRTQLAFSIFTDFSGFGTPDVEFTPGPQHEVGAEGLFGQLEAWAGALRQVRQPVAA
ncbi:NADPH-dependent FMN reductase [Amnibacterium endophyticum]|uniref:NADPH-dependent FMN reductase n=1 Tax=Amnibacterium endophyticum TaxID=2109337 RepID=A0ABW4LG06_9MICO